MTETTISGAIVWPEDSGTGAPVDASSGDWASAAYQASMALARGTDYVETGISVTYNPSTTSIDISGGLAFVQFTGATNVQLSSSSYDEAWNETLVFMVSVPSMSNLALDAGAVNDVYLAVDPTAGDGARYRYGSSVSTPTNPHIKLAEVDTSTDTTTELAQEPVGAFTAIDTAELRGDITGGTSVTDLTGPNLFINGSGQLAGANMRTGVSDAGTQLYTNAADVNFTTNLSVTDDGDGSVSVSSTDTDTNTHTNVSDDGTQVLADTADINFGTNVSVSDDGDGSVTVSSTDTNTDTHTSVSDDGTQVVTGTTDIDFGTNLAVSDDGDGSVTVDSEESTTLYMSEYAPSGGVVDTAFDTAVSDAQEGDRIVFDHNTYELTQQTIISKSLTIDATSDSTISMTNTSNNNAHILFEGGGLGGSTTTTELGNVGERTLSVNDETIVSAGDDVLLIEDGYTASNVDSQIQFAEVESTATGEITLLSTLSKEFVSGTSIYQVDLLAAPAIKNISTDGGGNRHLQFRWCKAPVYDSVSISEYLEVSLYALDCWQPRYRDVEATDPEGLLSGEGEPVSLYRCTDAYIESPRVYDCRRGIDFAWGTRNVTVVDPILHGCVIGGITVHGGSESGAISIQGGEIVCSTTNTDPAHNGHGISTSTTATTFVDGTTIYGRTNGILASGEMKVTNCWIGVADNVGADATAAIHIKHSSCEVRNTTIRDPDGVYEEGVWINAADRSLENIHVDVDMEYGSHNMVYVDGRQNNVKHVDIRGCYKHTSGTGDQGMLIHAHNGNTVRHIDVQVKLYFHPEQAIRIHAEATNTAGTIDNVAVHDSRFDCAQAAVFSDGGGTFETIRVRDCEMVTGATSLSFNESIGYLFITNNKVDGSIDTGSNSTTTVTGNLR